jgi:hypothetical protein
MVSNDVLEGSCLGAATPLAELLAAWLLRGGMRG